MVLCGRFRRLSSACFQKIPWVFILYILYINRFDATIDYLYRWYNYSKLVCTGMDVQTKAIHSIHSYSSARIPEYSSVYIYMVNLKVLPHLFCISYIGLLLEQPIIWVLMSFRRKRKAIHKRPFSRYTDFRIPHLNASCFLDTIQSDFLD